MATTTESERVTTRRRRHGSVDERRAEMAARVVAARAPARVADVLRGVALDALVPYAADYLAPGDYERLSALVDPAVRAARDAALDALAEALGPALETSDPDLIDRLDAARRWRV